MGEDGADEVRAAGAGVPPEPAREVLVFWREAGPERWFKRDAAFDALIAERFGALGPKASRGDLDGWAATPEGALALVVLLDQFPRNLHRGSARAFADDAKALALAEAAIARGDDRALPLDLRRFLLMPLMHAEDSAVQERSVALFEALARENPSQEEGAAYARAHRDVVARFGRFPHRNAALGRATTPEERRFLDEEEGFKG